MSKFERALSNNEISAFFKGEGEYFSPEEFNMGYHNELINWQGMLAYLEEKETPFELLVKYFRLYLNTVEENALDAWMLFSNIASYYFLRKKNRYFLTENEDLIDELTAEEKKKIGVLYRYLRENFDKVPGAAQMFPVDKQFEFTRKNGCPYDLFSF